MSDAPPSTSHVSLPSQTGATVLTMVSRSPLSRTKGNRMPMPRSKPSMTTYIIKAKAMMTAQMIGRSMPIASYSLASVDCGIDAVRCGRQRAGRPPIERSPVQGVASRFMRGIIQWALADELQHIGDASSEDGKVHHDEDDQRGGELQGGVIGDRVPGSHHAVDHPGLAAHFCGDPSRQDGHETRRPH